MAISVTLRKVNKGTEQPLYVRYSHNGANYFAPIGLSVNPKHFAKGRVTGPDYAPESNASIQAVVSRMEQAVRLASAGGATPTVENVKLYYVGIPAVQTKLTRLVSDWNSEGKSQIEILRHEIAELRETIAAKEAEIIVLQKEIGEYQPESMALLIDKFINTKNSIKPKGNKKSKNSFAQSTQNHYIELKKQLLLFDNALSIRAIDKAIMYKFEDFLISERFFNSSIQTIMIKLKAILNHYFEEYGLSKSYKDYSFDLTLKEESVIYLTTEEMKAFRNVSTYHVQPAAREAAEKAKDLALIMSETALRYSDSHILKAEIQGGYIVKTQQKTGGKVTIPFTNRLKSICEKHNYSLKGGRVENFNNQFRKLLAATNVPSLHEEITVYNWIGNEQIADTRPKYQHCGAHTLRRTMINQMLLRGKRYDQITKMTGHKDFTTFQTYVDRDTKAAEMDEVFDYLNGFDSDLPLMRVAS